MSIIDNTVSRSETTSLDARPPEPFLYEGKGSIPDGWALSRDTDSALRPPDPNRGSVTDIAFRSTAAENGSAAQLAFDPKRHTVVRVQNADVPNAPGTGTSATEDLSAAGFDRVDVPGSTECYFVRDRTAPQNIRSTPTKSASNGLGR